MPQLSFHSPVGDLTAFEAASELVSLDWGWVSEQTETPLLIQTRTCIDAYFDGQRLEFGMPLNAGGTVHQQKVWRAMLEIPYGQTRSYGDLADEIGSSAQAVGTACGLNPLPIIIPCHRVLGANGRIGGYSGGIGVETKVALLTLEGALVA